MSPPSTPRPTGRPARREDASPERPTRPWIGVDFADGHMPRPTRSWLPVMVLALVAALGIVVPLLLPIAVCLMAGETVAGEESQWRHERRDEGAQGEAALDLAHMLDTLEEDERALLIVHRPAHDVFLEQRLAGVGTNLVDHQEPLAQTLLLGQGHVQQQVGE